MCYSLYIVAMFGLFKTGFIFLILAVSWSHFFAYNNFNVFVETFFASFMQFIFFDPKLKKNNVSKCKVERSFSFPSC